MTTPVTLSAFVTVITPTVVSPEMFTSAVNVAAVPVIMLSVDATPVKPSPDPTNDVAVIIPAPTSIPVEFAVIIPAITDDAAVATPETASVVVVVTPVTTAPSGNVGEVLMFYLLNL